MIVVSVITNQMLKELQYYLIKNVEYKVHSEILSDNGTFILLYMTVHNQRFTPVNLYGPNIDNPNFIHRNIYEDKRYCKYRVHYLW